MSKLFRVTINPPKYTYSKTTIKPLYCIAYDKADCEDKVKSQLRDGYSIGKICYLADQLSGILFGNPKP